MVARLTVSIHALLAESDVVEIGVRGLVNRMFLSTLSLRRATWPLFDANGNAHVSIHALLAESDILRYLH